MSEVIDAALEDQVPPEAPTGDAPDSAPDADPSQEPAGGLPLAPAIDAVDHFGQVAERLDRMEQASSRQLVDLQRQLARVESRGERGWQDAAALKDVRKEIGDLKGQLATLSEIRAQIGAQLADIAQVRQSLGSLDGMDELRETVDLILKRTLEPEDLAVFERRRAEARVAKERATAAERERRLNERLARTEQALAHQINSVHLQPRSAEPAEPARAHEPEPKPTPDEDPEVRRVGETLDRRVRRAGYDPFDEAFVKRILAAAGDLSELRTPGERLEAMTDALVVVQAEDRKTEAEAARKAAQDEAKAEAAKRETERRNAARASVQTDRTRAGAPTNSYATQQALEAACARGEVDLETVRRLLPTLPRT